MDGETAADKGAGGVACLRPVMINAKITMITLMATVKSVFLKAVDLLAF